MKLFCFLAILMLMHSSLNAQSLSSPKYPRVGVACVVRQEGKILLGKRKGAHAAGFWGFPGGHLEFGESVEACAKRELLEETGLEALSLQLGPWVENVMEEGQKHYITIFVFIDQFSGTPSLLEPDKCEGWEWFTWDALPEPLFSPIPSLIAKERALAETPLHYQTIETSDGKIAYVDSGGPGFPVVLIHGNSCSSEVFKKQLAFFGDQYRMIAIDLPGHGRSDDSSHPDITYNIPGYAKILNEVVEKLGLNQFGVIGYSLGGNIALQWTQISNRIQGIMTISSAPMKYSEEAFLAYPPYEGNYGAHPDSLTESQATQYMSACGFDTEDKSVHFMIKDAMRTDGRSRAKMVASVLEGRGVDEIRIVSRLDMPLAVVIGSEDLSLGIDYITKLPFHNLWRSKIALLPHAQHAIVLHQTDQLHPLLRDFLEEIKKNQRN